MKTKPNNVSDIPVQNVLLKFDVTTARKLSAKAIATGRTVAGFVRWCVTKELKTK